MPCLKKGLEMKPLLILLFISLKNLQNPQMNSIRLYLIELYMNAEGHVIITLRDPTLLCFSPKITATFLCSCLDFSFHRSLVSLLGMFYDLLNDENIIPLANISPSHFVTN